MNREHALAWLVENFGEWPILVASLPAPDGWVWGTATRGEPLVQEKNGFDKINKTDWEAATVYLYQPVRIDLKISAIPGLLVQIKEMTAELDAIKDREKLIQPKLDKCNAAVAKLLRKFDYQEPGNN